MGNAKNKQSRLRINKEFNPSPECFFITAFSTQAMFINITKFK